MARFNKQTDWVLEITGQESGAVRRIEGFSNELTAENARWNGRTTDLPFFKTEPVEAALFFPNEASGDTSRVDLTVEAPRTYAGAVLADFEGGDDIFVGNFEFELQNSGISSEVPAGEGDAFYLLRGRSPPRAVPATSSSASSTSAPRAGAASPCPPPSQRTCISTSCSAASTPSTIAVVQLIVDGNGTGQYELDQDTVIPFGDIPVTFDEGWRLFSKPVSALGSADNPQGLTQEQAQNIVAVRVVLISDNNAQPATPQQVAFGIDYITFTAGGPLQP